MKSLRQLLEIREPLDRTAAVAEWVQRLCAGPPPVLEQALDRFERAEPTPEDLIQWAHEITSK